MMANPQFVAHPNFKKGLDRKITPFMMIS
jgi:hypothetical protein